MNESKRDKEAIKKGKNKYHVKRLNNEAEWGKECEIDRRIENDDTEKTERERKEDEYDMTFCARIVDSSNTQFLVWFSMFLYVRNLGF